jgi:hypothetical protein
MGICKNNYNCKITYVIISSPFRAFGDRQMPKFGDTDTSIGFRVQDPDDQAPGFRVPNPESELPGFNLVSNGSLGGSAFNFASPMSQGQSTPEIPLSYLGGGKPVSNLDFLTGAQSNPSTGFQPVAAGDLNC